MSKAVTPGPSLGQVSKPAELETWPREGSPRRGDPARAKFSAELLLVRVFGDPRPEPRPRYSPVTQGIFVPSSADAWKKQIRAATQSVLLSWGWDDMPPPKVPLGFAAEFLFRRPKSHLRTGRNSGLVRASAPEHHVQTPDLDNLLKAAQDALGVWDKKPPLAYCSDAQIDRYGHVSKRWARPDEEPGAYLAVWRA